MDYSFVLADRPYCPAAIVRNLFEASGTDAGSICVALAQPF